MPRKQNGFGSSKSFSVNSISKDINKGKSIQGSGRYPSDRQFGSTVTRSAVLHSCLAVRRTVHVLTFGANDFRHSRMILLLDM